MLAVAIVLLGGATAAAIVITKDEGHSSSAGDAAAEASGSNEFDEAESGERAGYEEGPDEGFEEEEEEEPSPSPAQVAQNQVQGALRAHFRRLEYGEYGAAFSDLTAGEQESAGGESAWVSAQKEDGLQGFSLSVETSLLDAHSAQATVVSFRTRALATGCNDWSGYWEMSKVYGEWLISAAKLEKEPC